MCLSATRTIWAPHLTSTSSHSSQPPTPHSPWRCAHASRVVPYTLDVLYEDSRRNSWSGCSTQRAISHARWVLKEEDLTLLGCCY